MEQFLEYFGVVTGLSYLVLEIMQRRLMWVVGVLTSFTYIFVFFFSGFYADMSLNIYYVCISIYGFWQWKKKPTEPEEPSAAIIYRHLGPGLGVVLLFITAGLFAGMYFILSRLTDSPVPAGDAFTTALSVTATWMLARRILEHWWVWVVINFVSLWLYFQRGLYPTSFLFACYGVLAVAGWMNWKRKGKHYDRNL